MCQNSCGTTVANALRTVAGVEHAEASFAEGTATVRGSWRDGAAPTAELVAAVECVGFGAVPAEANDTAARGARGSTLQKLPRGVNATATTTMIVHGSMP